VYIPSVPDPINGISYEDRHTDPEDRIGNPAKALINEISQNTWPLPLPNMKETHMHLLKPGDPIQLQLA
jgi:hypothetical protein